MIRVALSALLLLLGLVKLIWPSGQATWVDADHLMVGAVLEVTLGLAMLRRRLARHAAVAVAVLAAALLVWTAMHLGDPRPCGCMGSLAESLWLRVTVLSVMGLAAVRVATSKQVMRLRRANSAEVFGGGGQSCAS